MKPNRGNYREVKTLPAGAMTVSIFAREEGIGLNPVYDRWAKREKNPINFEIIFFMGQNWVIRTGPKKVKK